MRAVDRHKIPCLRNAEKEMLAKSLLEECSDREREETAGTEE